MERRAKFLVVSNMRSGSTWLAATLGALPDAATDYEIKWKINYQAQEIHYVLDETSKNVSGVIEDIDGDAPIAGSKFVFDPVELSDDDYVNLRKKFSSDVRIVHLVRRYRDIFLSARRGFSHRLNEASPRRVGKHLMASFAPDRHGVAAKPAEPALISSAACYEELKTYFRNDAWTMRLRDDGIPYLLVSYERLGERLADIVRFIGSSAPSDAVADLVRRPVTVKLPEVPAADVIANIAELEPLFEQVERLRAYVLGDAIAREYGLASRY